MLIKLHSTVEHWEELASRPPACTTKASGGFQSGLSQEVHVPLHDSGEYARRLLQSAGQPKLWRWLLVCACKGITWPYLYQTQENTPSLNTAFTQSRARWQAPRYDHAGLNNEGILATNLEAQRRRDPQNDGSHLVWESQIPTANERPPSSAKRAPLSMEDCRPAKSDVKVEWLERPPNNLRVPQQDLQQWQAPWVPLLLTDCVVDAMHIEGSCVQDWSSCDLRSPIHPKYPVSLLQADCAAKDGTRLRWRWLREAGENWQVWSVYWCFLELPQKLRLPQSPT